MLQTLNPRHTALNCVRVEGWHDLGNKCLLDPKPYSLRTSW